MSLGIKLFSPSFYFLEFALVFEPHVRGLVFDLVGLVERFSRCAPNLKGDFMGFKLFLGSFPFLFVLGIDGRLKNCVFADDDITKVIHLHFVHLCDKLRRDDMLLSII